MLWLIIILIIIGILFWIYRFYFLSFLIYLSVRFERKAKDIQLLSSLRDSLIHERKKKIAGLEMMLSSWERGDEIQPRYEYFEELLSQLKNLVKEERKNLMAVTKDIWLWGKLWCILRRIEKTAGEKRERSEIRELRNELSQIQSLIDQVVEDATEQFSFTLNQVVAESVKIVRIEKSDLKDIEIQEQLDDVGNTIRFSYDKFKDWQRILTNLIRNAVEAVEAKQSGDGVASRFIVRGGEESYMVKVSTMLTLSDQAPISTSVSVCIEDSGIGMDEITRTSFYKKGFTFGKEGGLGLGVSEESVQLINQYGNWQVESQKGVGTKIAINIDKEKAQKLELILPEPKPFLRTRLAFGLFVLVLAVIGLSLLFIFDKYSRFWVDWNPAYAEVRQGRQILVYNSKDKQLWMHEFERSVGIRETEPGVKEPFISIVDFDQDGWKEILVSITYDIQTTSKLFCLDHEGKVKWVFSGGQGFKRNASTQDYKPDIFFITNILVDDFMSSGQKQILVNSVLAASFPCQLALLDHQGDVTGEYWHPGLIPFTIFTDLNGDGKKELLCAGINNRLNWRTVVFTLDPKQLIGKIQGPPYYIFDDIKPAKEEKYVVLPHIKNVDWQWEQISPEATPQNAILHPDHILLILPDGRLYSLTRDLLYESCIHRMGYFGPWQKIVGFPFELDLKKDSPNWSNFEIYENGVRVK